MSGNRSLMSILLGVLLIGWGLIFLIGQFFSVSVGTYIWPVFIILVGLMFFVGMLAGGRRVSGLAIPGAIITMVGLILLIQNITGQWWTWSYAWTLIVSAVGVGLFIQGTWGGHNMLRQVGLRLVGMGLVLFLLFGAFFQFGAILLGVQSTSGVVWAVALVAFGIYLLVTRPKSAGGLRTSAEAPVTAVTAGPLGSFTRLAHYGVGNIILTQGDQPELRIEASEEMRQRVRTEIKDDTLEIHFDQDWWDWLGWIFTWNWRIDYYLTMSEIKSLSMHGAGNLKAELLKAADLELSQSGAGNIEIDAVVADNLTLVTSGAGNVKINSLNVSGLEATQKSVGNIELAGQAARQNVTLSGAGNYNAVRLESQQVAVRLSGVGNASVWASQSLDAKLSGAGNVDYRGNPALTKSISGLGNVRNSG